MDDDDPVSSEPSRVPPAVGPVPRHLQSRRVWIILLLAVGLGGAYLLGRHGNSVGLGAGSTASSVQRWTMARGTDYPQQVRNYYGHDMYTAPVEWWRDR